MANTSQIRLTVKALNTLLSEFHLQSGEADVTGLKKPDSLAEKTLFYTEGNGKQVGDLLSFLSPGRYGEIRERMKANGYRSGFACLFYGAPGTGKTETVYQIARKTGRSILAVNVPEIKSKWVGDTEKNIKAVFDRYLQQRHLLICVSSCPRGPLPFRVAGLHAKIVKKCTSF